MEERPLNTSDFRTLVDDSLQAAPSPIFEPVTPQSRKSDLSKALSQQIRENLPKKFAKHFHEMLRIKAGLIAELILEGFPLDPYFEIAAAIQDAVRSMETPPDKCETSPNWPEVIRLGRLRCELSPNVYRHNDEVMRFMESRPFALAEAARRLRKKGYACTIQDTYVVFPETERKRMVHAIEEKIRHLGALHVIDNLCKILKARSHSAAMERYLMPSGLGFGKIRKEPSLPFNFILHLAIKHVSAPKAHPSDAQDKWNELVVLATDYSAIYDVEPYSHWELEFRDAYTLSPYLTDIAIYDQMFNVGQYRASDVGKVLRNLFNWLTPMIETALGWSVVEAAAVAERILASGNATGVSVFRRSDIVSACNDIAPVPKIGRILDVFTHTKNPNAEFLLPEKPGALTFTQKPLIRLSDNELAVVDRAICAPAFYESIATAVRQHDRNAQGKIGTAAERFFLTELAARGVAVLSGEYQYPEAHGECDAVIETSDTIVFLESKAKALTNAARAGSDARILIDLLNSLIDATSQALKHELLLRKRGSITLKRGDDQESVLEWKERQIEKIALTILDFGRFQDRTVLSQVLTILLSATVQPRDPAFAGKFQELNAKTESIRKQIEELATLEEDFTGQPFFTCWFLSIPQMLVLLDRVNSNEEFKRELWRTRHLSTHSLDWYFEMDYALKLANHKSQSPRTP